MRGRKPTKFDGETRTIAVRVSKDMKDWFDGLGDGGADLIRSLIDEFRMTKNAELIDRTLDDARGLLLEKEKEAIDIKQTIKALEARKARLMNEQMDFLRVRQTLVEKFIQNPGGFAGWLSGPANEHLVAEARFANLREAAEFVRGERDRRIRGKSPSEGKGQQSIEEGSPSDRTSGTRNKTIS